VLSSIKVMDSVNYILTAVICSCEGGLDAHANKERGNILSSEGETLVGSGVVGNPYLMGVTSELLVIRPQSQICRSSLENTGCIVASLLLRLLRVTKYA